MNRIKLPVLLSLTLLGFLLLACAKAPTSEMAAASAAVEKASSTSDTVEYAPSSLAKAKDLLSRMNTEAEEKRYDAAKLLAAQAEEAAEQAIIDGTNSKLKAKSDAELAISNTKKAISALKELFASAKTSKIKNLNTKEYEKLLLSAETGITEADNDFNRTSYKSALAKANTANTITADAQKLLSDAVKDSSKKK